ncbi:MAG: response regulator [Rhodospirillales bacterium]|nr:response regulator [Rhodospirillales bacterium]
MARILVIEDDEPIQQLLVAVFENDGHQVTCAADGEAGLEFASKELPGLIVTDMSLPLKTGWEVIAALKANAATRTIPVIALSAHDSQGDRDAGHEAGCDAYIGKPIDITVLMKNVNSILGKA